MEIDRYLIPPSGERSAVRARLRSLRERLGAARTQAAALRELGDDPDPYLIAPMLDGAIIGADGVHPGRYFLRDGRTPCPILHGALCTLLALAPARFRVQQQLLALEALDLDGMHLSLGLAPFARIEGLRALQAVGATGRFGGIAEISRLPHLQRLDLQDAELLDDLRPLAQATALHTLHLNGRLPDLKLPDFAPLTKLERLSLPPSTRRKTLRPVKGLVGLKALCVPRWEALTNLAALRSLVNLRTLSLEGCRALTDVSPLAGVPQLRQLDVSGCRALRDLSPLAGLETLHQLTLGRIPAAMTFTQGPQTLTGRGALAVYFRRVRRGAFRREKSRLGPLYRRLRALIHSTDPEHRAQGLELLSALDDPELLDLLVQGTRVEDGRLISGPAFLRGGQHPSISLDLAMLRALSAVPGHPMLGELARIRELTIETPTANLLQGLAPLRGLQSLTIFSQHTEPDLSYLAPLAALRTLTLRDARALTALDGLPLGALTTLNLFRLPELRELELDAPALTSLKLMGCGQLERIRLNAPNLKTLTLDQLPRLRTAEIAAPALREVKLWRLHGLRGLELTAPALRNAELDQFNALRVLPPSLLAGGLLEQLTLSRMHVLEALPDLSGLPRLEKLGLYDVPRLEALPKLSPSVSTLRLENLIGLSDLRQLSSAPFLKLLQVRFARSIRLGAEALFRLPMLHTLELRAAGALSRQLGSELVVFSGNVQERLSEQRQLKGP